MHIYPLLFEPVYKDYLWGGSRIGSKYSRTDTPDICAESWEISDRSEGESIVSNGVYRGNLFNKLIDQFGSDLLGSDFSGSKFPLLIKIIDAKKDLSVQVHPNDETADLTGGEAKTEMWYVLDADKDARIYAGLQEGVSHDSFLKSLERKTLADDTLASIPAVPGEAVFVPGGRVHAIGAGCLLLEVQQNSNTTYRVYDWDRTDKDGKSRPLHLEDALKVIEWIDATPTIVRPDSAEKSGRPNYTRIISCPYFSTQLIDLTSSEEILNDGHSFHVIFTSEGTATVEAGDVSVFLPTGTSCLLPACAERYSLTPTSSTARLIHITALRDDKESML